MVDVFKPKPCVMTPQQMQEHQIMQAIQEQIAQSQMNVKVEIDPDIFYSDLGIAEFWWNVNSVPRIEGHACENDILKFTGANEGVFNPHKFANEVENFKIVNHYPPTNELIDLVRHMSAVYDDFNTYVTKPLWAKDTEPPNNFNLSINYTIYVQCKECNAVHLIDMTINISPRIAKHIIDTVESQMEKAQKEQEIRNKIITPNGNSSIILPR